MDKVEITRAVVNLRGISCYMVPGGDYSDFLWSNFDMFAPLPPYLDDIFNLALFYLFYLFHLQQEMTRTRHGMSPPCTIHCFSNIVQRSLHSSSQPIRKRGVGFKATQSSLGVSEDSKDIKDSKRSGKSQVKVYLELNL